MHYQNVCLESFGYTLPDEIVTSDEIEKRLSPLYERLRLPAGRLELMTGIRERRFWPPGTLPSDMSVVSGAAVLAASRIDPRHIGRCCTPRSAAIISSRPRPAAFTIGSSLPKTCQVFDVSNACLGILNGMLLVANMIELGQIAGLVVGTEGSRQVVETTIDWLNRDTSLTRNDVKLAVASLTMGSASCAVLLTDRELSRTQNRIVAATARAHTAISRSVPQRPRRIRCRRHAAADAHRLRAAAARRHCHRRGHVCRFSERIALGPGTDRQNVLPPGRLRTPQADVRVARLDPAIDFPTVEFLGNTGSVALPITMALGLEQGRLAAGDRVAMLGIGSGINSLMIGLEWQHSLVQAERLAVAAIAGAD